MNIRRSLSDSPCSDSASSDSVSFNSPSRPADTKRPVIEPLEERRLLSVVSPFFSGGNSGSSSSSNSGSTTTTPIVTGTVTGTVTDSNGNALSDARVKLMLSGTNDPLFAYTDSSGDYTIDNVPAGAYTVTAHDHGYTPATSSSFTVTSGTNTAPTVELAAIEYGTVSGEVTDADGNPLTDAHVRLTLSGSSSTPGDSFIATTDSSGDYVINNVPTGAYTVTARDHGYVANTSATFTVAEGSDTAPTVQLTAIVYGTVTGQITDTSGNPLSGVRVRLTVSGGTGPANSLLATTDSNGDYTFDNVVAGTYTVTARDQGYVKSTSSAFTVASGTNTAPTLQLAAIQYGSISGLVTDSSSNPLAGAWVELISASSSNGPSFGMFAQTNSSGDYSFSSVVTGSYTVQVFDQGYVPGTSSSFTVSTGSNTAPTVALTAIVYGTVTGQVTDSSGNPLADARVRLNLQTSSSTPGFGQGPGVLFATTDSNGDYTIDNVPTGSYTVTAHDQGYTASTSAAFTVSSGTTTAPTLALAAAATPPMPQGFPGNFFGLLGQLLG